MGYNDIDFAVMMVEHHKGAVEMSKVEVAQGTNAEMKAFAQKFIDDQNEEITFMQDFISKASKAETERLAQLRELNWMDQLFNMVTYIRAEFRGHDNIPQVFGDHK